MWKICCIHINSVKNKDYAIDVFLLMGKINRMFCILQLLCDFQLLKNLVTKQNHDNYKLFFFNQNDTKLVLRYSYSIENENRIFF